MANFTYTPIKELMIIAGIDLQEAGWDVQVMLCMTNTTADTEQDATNIVDFTTLDEFVGSGYTAGGVDLANQVVAQDTGNNRAEFDADDLVPAWSSVVNGARQIEGILLKRFVDGTAANDIPLAWIDTVTGGTSFPFDPAGGDINITWNAEGILQVT